MTRKKLDLYIVTIHILCWILLLSCPSLLFSGYTMGESSTKQIIIIDILLIGAFYINFSILAPMFLLRKKITFYLSALIALVISTFFLIQVTENHDILKKHSVYLDKSKNDNLKEEMMPANPHHNREHSYFLFVTIAFIGIGTSIKITTSWIRNEKEKNIIKKEKLNAELSYLKSQIDPHFFFNTLNNIYSLAQLKSDKAPQTILKLSELMRYNIYEADKETVYLKDEINYIQNFIDLQRIRLTKNVDIDYYVRGKVENKKIEPLIFLPFIENAFKHGIDYTNNCSIDIEISIEDEEITLLVINNTTSRKEKISEQSGVGLSNIKKRLELLYKNHYSLDISENENKFMVKLTLNLNEH